MGYTILVDSREKNPRFTLQDGDVIVKGLKTGDYSVLSGGIDYSNSFAVEFKSAVDLFGTLGSGSKRFKKELNRASSFDYFAIVVECSYTDIERKFFPGAQHIRIMKGETINKIVNTLRVKYGVHIINTNSREESKKIIRGLIEAYLCLQKT